MPLPDGLTPTKVVGVHLNYRSRAEQRGRVPAEPSYFLKPPSSISDGGPVIRPQGAELLAFEGEIARDPWRDGAQRHNGGGGGRDRLVRAGQRLRRARLPLGRPRLECPYEGPGRLHADRPCRGRHRRRPRVVAADHARQRRGRPAGNGRRADLLLRTAGRRSVALHDARARRRHPHRDACRRECRPAR